MCVLFLPRGQSSHCSFRNPLCHRCIAQGQLRAPQNSLLQPPSWSPALKKALRGAARWQGPTSEASAVLYCWCVLQGQSLHQSFLCYSFSVKSLWRNPALHLAGNERKLPSQPGVRKHVQPNKPFAAPSYLAVSWRSLRCKWPECFTTDLGDRKLESEGQHEQE